MSVFNIAFDVAKAIINGEKIDMLDIIKNAGKAATDLANAICDPPTAQEILTGVKFMQ